MNKKIMLIALLLQSVVIVKTQAQYLIRLSRVDNPTQIKLMQVGSRVGCVLNQEAKGRYTSLSHLGIVRRITPDSISIDKSRIAITDIRSIGKRMGGTTILSALLTFGGVGLIKSGTTDNVPCPTCQTVGSDTGGSTASVVGGVGMIGLGILIIANNAPKSLKKWKLEVVEQSPSDRKK
ncbi:MAG: hypothetical protein JST14_00105 [Bacteroidetes bacterium]|nr:hypothetical protein [Bacteroidota bacterium]